MFRLLLILSFLFISSCGKEDGVKNAVFSADYYLSQGDCSSAKKALDKQGYSSDARYVGAYAATYGCIAGYSELDLFKDNIEKFKADSAEAVLKSFATFTTSNDAAPDSHAFKNILQGIKVILDSKGVKPSAKARVDSYGSKVGTDLNMQALYMILVELGKFVKLYGNTDADGVKGAGTHGNICFLDYIKVPYVFDPDYGACTGGNKGSPYLDFTDDKASAAMRACSGVILFNNFIDILKNLSFGTSEVSEKLRDALANIDAKIPPLARDSLKVTSMDECLDLINDGQDSTFVEAYFRATYERFLR